MALTPFSLLLLRRLSFASQKPNPPLRFFVLKPFSTSQSSPFPSSSDQGPKPSSLSARLSFVFDQIDAIEKQQQQLLSQKDQTLQRIRAWRQSRESQIDQRQKEPSQLEFGAGFNSNDKDNVNSSSSEMGLEVVKEKKETVVEVVHPWPEWIELMERLVKQNYFDHRRKDEDRMVEDLGFDASEFAAEDDKVELDFTRDFKVVQTACLNFGKDRFDILRSLSRQDIQVLVGFGCPSADKKVVFSAKLLRKHIRLDEGDVCSSCSLRNSCERAYLVTNKEDEARTIDVMRVLLVYAFDPVNGSVVNKAFLKQKSIKTVVRKLLHEVVKLSAVPIDPNLPPPVIKKPPPKVKQPPPPSKKRVGRDDVEMKKGDWLCPKCDFLNFAKNTVCLQCDAKRPKRQLLPGEWECPECNFLNYRRNMDCFHCQCKRPPDEFKEYKMQEKPYGPRTRLEKIANRQEVSNAWNFDFDDNESDGADVASFEYADSSITAENSAIDSHARVANVRGPECDFDKPSRLTRVHEHEYSDGDTTRPGMGFNDFDDEDDDIDSYELDTHNTRPVQKTSPNDFSEVEGSSGSEDFEGFDNNVPAHRGTRSPSYNKPAKSTHLQSTFSGSEDDGLDLDLVEDLTVHPNWKSSHVADSRHSRGRGQVGPSKRLSFGSDDELGLNTDVEDDFDANFRSRQKKGNNLNSYRRDFQRKRMDSRDGPEFDDDDKHSSKSRYRGSKVETDRRQSKVQGRGNHNFTRDTKFRSSDKTRGRMNSFDDDFDEPSQHSRGYSKGSQKTSRDGWGKRDSDGDMRKFKGRRGGDSFGKQQRGRFKENDRDMDGNVGEFKNSRRVVER